MFELCCKDSSRRWLAGRSASRLPRIGLVFRVGICLSFLTHGTGVDSINFQQCSSHLWPAAPTLHRHPQQYFRCRQHVCKPAPVIFVSRSASSCAWGIRWFLSAMRVASRPGTSRTSKSRNADSQRRRERGAMGAPQHATPRWRGGSCPRPWRIPRRTSTRSWSAQREGLCSCGTLERAGTCVRVRSSGSYERRGCSFDMVSALAVVLCCDRGLNSIVSPKTLSDRHRSESTPGS